MKNENIIFTGKDGREHKEGDLHLEFTDYTDDGEVRIEKEQIFASLQDMKVVLDFLREMFPDGWKVSKNRVVSVNVPEDEDVEI